MGEVTLAQSLFASGRENTRVNAGAHLVLAAQIRVIEQELHKNAAIITKVSETASKEYAIESALDKMQGAWATVKLLVEEYRETGK